MAGKPGRSGGTRAGAGRKAQGKQRKKYVVFFFELPETPAQEAAYEWYKTLKPKQRMESVLEDWTFQECYNPLLEK
jgi:hypothetical protein